jgi:phage/conjugal plasmid C-4 type zinc finger TraR family protein
MLNPSFRRSPAETAGVRERLEAMLNALDTRADEIEATWSAMSEEVFDELDRAQHVSEARLAAALDAATTEAREQLVHALAVLDAGHYGVCERCEKAIGAARLAFRPESTKCLHCQSADDARPRMSA